MLIAVRHGDTQLNGADGKERSRGWLPVPLNLDGMGHAQQTAQELSKLRGDIASIHSSDLPRAVQTAHEIGMGLGQPINPTPALRDWNVGDFAGQEVSKILPATQHLIKNPTELAPGGESYSDYMERAIPFLKQLVEDPHQVHVAVSHNRLLTLLHAISPDTGPGITQSVLLDKGPVNPGGFMVMDQNWHVRHMHMPRTK